MLKVWKNNKTYGKNYKKYGKTCKMYLAVVRPIKHVIIRRPTGPRRVGARISYFDPTFYKFFHTFYCFCFYIFYNCL